MATATWPVTFTSWPRAGSPQPASRSTSPPFATPHSGGRLSLAAENARLALAETNGDGALRFRETIIAALEAESADSPDGYNLAALDWQALLRDGVPEVEYLREPYLPKGARIWVWGATGTVKSLWALHEAAALSREGIRVSYFSEENPLREDLRRVAKLQPDPRFFRLFQRTGMDLADPRWVAVFLEAVADDAGVFLDSWTDLWSGDEKENRDVQQFDATVLKPCQARGVTPVVLHHTGHRQMFSDRGGATAGRGASSLGQKADVALEFKTAGEDLFTIVYAKSRIGGIRRPEQTFKVEDTDDDRIEIVATGSPDAHAAEQLAEMAAQAILTAPRGYLTTSELRMLIGGRKERQSAAFGLLGDDSRVRMGVEKVQTKDGKYRDSKVWRPAGGALGDRFDFGADGGASGTTPPPIGVWDGLPT